MKPPFRSRSAQKRVRRGLAATIDRLAKNLEAQLGRAVSDEEIARSLAMNVAHIRRARAKSGSVPQ
jgi:DNA-directed RNA polymerase specialized sigma subunit